MAETARETFGARMRQARETRGISLRDIATRTRISLSTLEALERDNISRMPGGIFSRAFVRAYATEIGLDPEAAIREFLAQHPHDFVTAGSPHVPPEDHVAVESAQSIARTAVTLGAMSVPIVTAILYYSLWVPAASRTPETAAADQAVFADAGAREPLRFVIAAIRDVSIDVRIDGLRREQRGLSTGEAMTVEADREVTLGMSDAEAVRLEINGEPAVVLGAPGEARVIDIGRGNFGAFLAVP
ncbi:MAG: helix-turn-helix domain-containing protein [Acidimicrobiia bacterium]|nr:helix-turn-helix domain-containing protein [Acidimicrobiia bacterium]